MPDKSSSNWNETNELRCLIIFKKLKVDNFPRGKQLEYCREMSEVAKLSPGKLSAMVSNYKSIAGVNEPSNVSENARRFYKRHKYSSIEDLERLINENHSH